VRALKFLVPLVVLAAGGCLADRSSTPAQPFWAEFRQAVLADDMDKIARVTRFPFEVRGPDDSNPIEQYDQAGFQDVYRRLMAQPVYLPLSGVIIAKSMRELIAEQKTLAADDQTTADTFHFHQFEFELSKGRWQFVRAYLEE
jgi:hypothetical protein